MGRHVQKIGQYRIALILTLFLVTGFRSSDPVNSQPQKEKLSTYERSFKPSFYDTEVYLYKKNDTSKAFGETIEHRTTALPETLQGFRIQLIATGEYDKAVMLRNEVNEKYPDVWTYTVYDAPMYKVRAGDFSNRAEAKLLLDQLQTDGYKAAWIVPDKVIKNQPPKPPLPVQIDSTTTQGIPEE